jgi:methanol metabolism-related c-type cytochrome
MRNVALLGAAALAIVATAAELRAQNPEAPIDPVENPYIVVDGKVDPGTYNGFRRYHNTCHVCHGPDGLGSSFGPTLVDTLKAIDYYAFSDVVVNGRTNAANNSVMPSFGTDANVMPYLDDIYGYLKARSDGAIPPGRPQKIPDFQMPQ